MITWLASGTSANFDFFVDSGVLPFHGGRQSARVQQLSQNGVRRTRCTEKQGFIAPPRSLRLYVADVRLVRRRLPLLICFSTLLEK